MKCPMLIIGYLSKENPEVTRKCECGQEECGWWDEHGGRCAVAEIPRILLAIGKVLGRIHDESGKGRTTFRCHYCGVTETFVRSGDMKGAADWYLKEHVDGHSFWLCYLCNEDKK